MDRSEESLMCAAADPDQLPTKTADLAACEPPELIELADGDTLP
jgi:hypothetical protein